MDRPASKIAPAAQWLKTGTTQAAECERDASVQEQLEEIDAIAKLLGLTPKWKPYRALVASVLTALPAIYGIVEALRDVT